MRQDIGYISNSYNVTDFSGVMVGLEINVSSSKITAKEITTKIEEFIEKFLGEFLDKYTDEEFNETRGSIISIKMKPFQNIGETAEVAWAEIKNGLYVMDRKDKEIAFLNKLTPGDFRTWIRAQFKERKWFCLELESAKTKKKHDNVKTMNEFKASFETVVEYDLEM